MLTFFIALILSYLYHGFGVTVGYHRLLSHRAFKCPLWLEYLIVSGGYLGFEGSPTSWVCTHRMHHRYTDDEGDPHKPADGFWHAWGTWLVRPKVFFSGEQVEQVCPDLWRDPVYRYLDYNHTRKHAKVCLWLAIAFKLSILILFGPWALLGNMLGNLLVFVGPFWVNSVCHLPHAGYKNFDTTDASRNVAWVGFWALGEGWHNNHHAVPQSARHGIKIHEIDISWMFIWFLGVLGLATNIRLPKEPKLAPALTPEFSALLSKMSDKQAPASEEAELVDQLLTSCDQLSNQLAAAKVQVGQ